MANIIKNLPIGSLDVDKFIKVNFFPTNERGRSRNSNPQECRHLGILVKDGHNISSSQMIQRITCSKCGARLDNNVNEWDLNRYQERLKLVLYELFFEGSFAVKKNLVKYGQYLKSILKTFFKIPKEYRDKMRVLVTDGEKSYQTLTVT